MHSNALSCLLHSTCPSLLHLVRHGLLASYSIPSASRTCKAPAHSQGPFIPKGQYFCDMCTRYRIRMPLTQHAILNDLNEPESWMWYWGSTLLRSEKRCRPKMRTSYTKQPWSYDHLVIWCHAFTISEFGGMPHKCKLQAWQG